MRRLLAFLLFVLLLPLTTVAQDQTMTWQLDPDTHIDVTDLGFRVYYPVRWQVSNEQGVVFAENQADIDALNSGGVPTGVTIAISGIAIASTDLDANPSLDDAVNFVLKTTQIQETERTEVPVLSHRSVSIFGQTADGRAGIGTIWVQNGFVILAIVGGPDMDTINKLAYTWGATIGSFSPLDSLPLGDEAFDASIAGFTIKYPDGWSLNKAASTKQATYIFEKESDFGNLVKAKGYVLGISLSPIPDKTAITDTTLTYMADTLTGVGGLDKSVPRREDVVLGQPAFTLIGENSHNHYWDIMTVTIVNKTAVMLLLSAPTQELAEAFEPTWIAMLQSITAIKA